MTPQSAKNKGRRLQQEVRDLLLELDPDGMYESRGMGQNGSDIVDPARRLPWDYIECRNREQWPSLQALVEEMRKCKSDEWAAVLRKNRWSRVWVLSDEVVRKLLGAHFKER